MGTTKAGPPALAVIGAGYWARSQIRAWRELARDGRVRLERVCDLDGEKARAFREEFGFAHADTDPAAMLDAGGVDLVDIISPTPTHRPLALMAIERGVPVIVQKPMAATLADARVMVRASTDANVPLIVHENYRWTPSVRAVADLLRAGAAGDLKDLTIRWQSGSHDYYATQPYFKAQKRFLLGEVGVHLIDVARFLGGGDVVRVFAQTQRFDDTIAGEDFARVQLSLSSGVTASCVMAMATPLEGERPSQTYVTACGIAGTVELGADYRIAVTTVGEGGLHTEAHTVPIPPLEGATPRLAALVASMVAAQGHYLDAIASGSEAETSGRDNLNTLAGTYAAYLSAEQGCAVEIEPLDDLARRLDAHGVGYPDAPSESAR